MVSPSVGSKEAKWSLCPSDQGLSFSRPLTLPPLPVGDPGACAGGGHSATRAGVCTGVGTLTELIEEEGVLVLLHVLGGAGLIQKERVDPLDVVYLHLRALTGMATPQSGPSPGRQVRVGTRGQTAWVQIPPQPPPSGGPDLSIPVSSSGR